MLLGSRWLQPVHKVLHGKALFFVAFNQLPDKPTCLAFWKRVLLEWVRVSMHELSVSSQPASQPASQPLTYSLTHSLPPPLPSPPLPSPPLPSPPLARSLSHLHSLTPQARTHPLTHALIHALTDSVTQWLRD